MKYTKSLRDNSGKKYTRGTVNNMIAPIIYFLDDNDIKLNKRKVGVTSLLLNPSKRIGHILQKRLVRSYLFVT